ncbi:alpha-mannosidase [Erysipelotrichaceae bacterium]|nr:alpha-mannosidase [Erysipelotrichaceae bacterium]
MKQMMVHVIAHSHWDKEWYFTASRSRLYFVKHLQEVMETLEQNPNFPYYLMDAQSSLFEEYLRYMPEDYKRIQKLVTAKKLYVGPWFTQSDQLVISAESIVRNLFYGVEYAKKLGHSMEVAYVPDAFGQGANMPQIYKSFGISNFLFWRGVADNRLKQTEFIWQGSEGTQMLAQQIPFGYYHGGNIPEEEADLEAYIEQTIEPLVKKASTRHIYFPNGFDQAPIRKNLPELIAMLNVVDSQNEYQVSNPEAFFTKIGQEVKNLPVITGELTEAKHSRIHKTIFSTRADLKQQNNRLENRLAHVLEPIATLCHTLGNRYPEKEIAEIWKLLFDNAAHDSIGGCNSDTTNRDIAMRYKIATDLIDNLLELQMRTVAEKIINTEAIAFTVFNPFCYNYSGIIQFEGYLPSADIIFFTEDGSQLEHEILEIEEQTAYVLAQTIQMNPSKQEYIPDIVYYAKIEVSVQNIPALGYLQYYAKIAEKKGEPANKVIRGEMIENKSYKVWLEVDNTLSIEDKKTGVVYKKQALFEENGDAGDSYNYSPPAADMIINSTQAKRTQTEIIQTKLKQTLKFTLEMLIPQTLKQRAEGICMSNFNLEVRVELRAEDELVRFDVTTNNTADSHRLCVSFDSGLANSFSLADDLFGVIRRPVALPELTVWVAEGWAEKPISIEPLQSFVTTEAKAKNLALMTGGVREYEFVGDDYSIIRLTLFRTFGFMGQENLAYRPGRASGETIIATPDAQLHMQLKCSFATYYYDSSYEEQEIAKRAQAYLNQPQVQQTANFLNGRLIYASRPEKQVFAKQYSGIQGLETEAIMSACKKEAYGDGILMRFYNPYITKDVSIPTTLFAKALKLDESTQTALKSELKPHEFITVLLKEK